MTPACFYREWNRGAEFIVGSNLLGLNQCSWRSKAVGYLYVEGEATCLTNVVMFFNW